MHTLEELKAILRYEPETGKLYWIKRRGKVMASSEAGSINWAGYRRIGIDRIDYFSHRIVWLFENGTWPEKNIDHINRIKTDNRIENLRDVGQSENIMNTGMFENNTSGYKGASYHSPTGKYQAQKRGKFLGYFNTAREAGKAYRNAP